MNSRSICEASTKRAACGGTRIKPESNDFSTFFAQPSRIPIGLCLAFSIFSSTIAFAERGSRLISSPNCAKAGVGSIHVSTNVVSPTRQTDFMEGTRFMTILLRSNGCFSLCNGRLCDAYGRLSRLA